MVLGEVAAEAHQLHVRLQGGLGHHAQVQRLVRAHDEAGVDVHARDAEVHGLHAGAGAEALAPLGEAVHPAVHGQAAAQPALDLEAGAQGQHVEAALAVDLLGRRLVDGAVAGEGDHALEAELHGAQHRPQ